MKAFLLNAGRYKVVLDIEVSRKFRLLHDFTIISLYYMSNLMGLNSFLAFAKKSIKGFSLNFKIKFYTILMCGFSTQSGEDGGKLSKGTHQDPSLWHESEAA